MELLYINEQRFTEEEVKETSKKYLKFPNRGKKITLLIIFLLLDYLLFKQIDPFALSFYSVLFYFCLVFGVLGLVYVLFSQYINFVLAKKLKASERRKWAESGFIPRGRILFYEDYIINEFVLFNDSEEIIEIKNKTYQYSDITDLRNEDEGKLWIFYFGYYFFVIHRRGFIQGSPDDFKKFINSKIMVNRLNSITK